MSEREVATARWGDFGPFGIVPLWVVDNPELSALAVRLYALLAFFAGAPEGETFKGRKELADRLSVSTKSVQRATAELVAAGAVTTEARRDGQTRLPNGYVIHAGRRSDEDVSVRGEGRGRPHPPGRESPHGPLIGERTPRRGANAPVGGDEVVLSPAAPKLTKVDGRNLGWDALAEVCGIRPDDRNRSGELAAALNGGKRGIAVGIREMVWGDLLIANPSAVEIPAEAFEHRVAQQIQSAARSYHVAMKGATITPLALAKWWRSLPTQRTTGGGLSPEDIVNLDIER